MRIPAEIVPRAESTTGKPAESRKAEPVGYINATGDDSPRSAPKRTRNESGDESRQARAQQRFGEMAAELPERRAAERRCRNIPVILDTRLRQTRRRKAGVAKIDLRV
jgi:hypothetical protein